MKWWGNYMLLSIKAFQRATCTQKEQNQLDHWNAIKMWKNSKFLRRMLFENVIYMCLPLVLVDGKSKLWERLFHFMSIIVFLTTDRYLGLNWGALEVQCLVERSGVLSNSIVRETKAWNHVSSIQYNPNEVICNSSCSPEDQKRAAFEGFLTCTTWSYWD